MKIKSLSPNLCVKDVNLTVEYYVENLGFTLTQSVPETGSFVWAEVRHGEVSVMFQQEDNLKDEVQELVRYPIGGSFTLFFRMEGVEDYFNRISDVTEVIKDLNRTFYGATEFAILDINGYILTFSELNGEVH